MTDYQMPVLTDLEQAQCMDYCEMRIKELADYAIQSKCLKVALAALAAEPAYWNVYHPNPDPNDQDDRLRSRCGPESAARRIASEIGGWVEPVYYGAPPVPVKQEGEQ